MLVQQTEHNKRQEGQALPLGLATLAFGALLTLVLFDTAQITSHKMRLANAADAAVYSGLTWEARSLNYQAYLNRAMVANQVAIAQTVTLVSWSKYLQITARNIDATIGNIPVPGVKALTSGVSRASLQINTLLKSISRAAVGIIDLLNRALSLAQVAAHNASTLAAWDTLDKVAKLNDPNFETNTKIGIAAKAYNTWQWDRFTKQYDDADSLERFANVVDTSRDPFTQDRSNPIFDVKVWPVRTQFVLAKEGETRLQRQADPATGEQSWQWKAKDTLSLHLYKYDCDWLDCDWEHEAELPIGWGAAYVSSVRGDIECPEGLGVPCPPWSRNALAEAQAEADRDRDGDKDDTVALNTRYTGVLPYRDLKDLSAKNKDPRVPMAVEVVLRKKNLRTSAALSGLGSPAPKTPRRGLDEGPFGLNDAAASGVLSAVSTGEVYFRRPEARGDGQAEYGNLFNPYWDVRLTYPKAERYTVWVARGLRSMFAGGGAVN